MYYQPAPIEPPKVRTSKRTKWMVVILFVLVCGSPGVGLYWLHRYYQVFNIASASMEPTLRPGDRLLVDMRYFQRHAATHGEIVVTRRPDYFLVVRVVALPGDTIEGHNGLVYLNGDAVSEPYAQHVDDMGHTDSDQDFGPVTLKAGKCFVMGDNRPHSLDSRYPKVGPVPMTTIVGRPLYVISSTKGDRAWERIK